MPEARAPVSNAILVVRIVAVLDSTREGKEGAAALEQQFAAARAAVEALPAGAERSAAEVRAVREIEAERARRREALLVRARAVAEKIRAQRGAALVMDAGLTLAMDAGLDITAEVVAALDKG